MLCWIDPAEFSSNNNTWSTPPHHIRAQCFKACAASARLRKFGLRRPVAFSRVRVAQPAHVVDQIQGLWTVRNGAPTWITRKGLELDFGSVPRLAKDFGISFGHAADQGGVRCRRWAHS
jgi:hypothetical protein